MQTLAIAKLLEKTFAHRGLTTHAADRAVEAFPHGDKKVFVVLDLSVSRTMLSSKSFSSFNYFEEGLLHLEGSGSSITHVRHFFENGMLFMEGPDHHAIKQETLRLLENLCALIEHSGPRLERFIAKRRTSIESPWEFSTLFVRLCMALVIVHLTGASATQVMRALRNRRNVFYFYFHAIRHKEMNAVLARLSEEESGSESDTYDRVVRILVQSLVMMGYDPLVGSLCASLVEQDPDVRSGPSRYCPTSFVSRVCVENTSIGDHQFNKGDICYVSLLPARGEQADKATFPFGMGAHACVGKRFSLLVLQTAGDIARNLFPDGFKRMPETCADGAFLSFRMT